MKITDIQTFQLAGPELAAPMYPAWAPGSNWHRWGGTVCKVFTDEGIVGLGSPGYASAPIIESWIKPQLIGKDPFALEQHARIFRSAGAAWGIEMALWDIIGKACNVPGLQALGRLPRPRPRLRLADRRPLRRAARRGYRCESRPTAGARPSCASTTGR